MKTAVMYARGSVLRGNQAVRKWINGQRKFSVFIDGDNLIIKRSRSPLDFASRSGDGAMTPEEVSVETHAARRQ